MGPVGAHHLSTTPQEDPDASISVTRVLRRQLAHRRQNRRIAH